jgi:hypothetical protein
LTWVRVKPTIYNCGYHEIQKPKIRYRLIDRNKLLQFLNADKNDSLTSAHRKWVESQLKTEPVRQEHFSRSIAVASKLFIQKFGKRSAHRESEGVWLNPN